MSTKIHNGYKLPNMSFFELNNFCKSLSKKIIEKRQQMFKKLIKEIIEEKIANTIIGTIIPKYLNNNIYWSAMDEVKNNIDEINNTQKRNPRFDFDFSVCFFGLEDKILAMLFTEQKELKSIWEKQNIVEEYGYWNNTDPLESVSEEEWEQREKDWDKALDHNNRSIPSLNGLIFEPKMQGEYFPLFDKDEKVNLDNIIKISTNEYLMKWWLKINNFKSDETIQGYMSEFKKLGVYMQTKEGKRKHNITKNKMKWRLKSYNGCMFVSGKTILEETLWNNY